MKSYITATGNNFVRKTFELSDDLQNVFITISADCQRYLRDYCLPLRGDGNDGNWLMGGSFVKFRLYLDGQLIGIGPFRAIMDGSRVEHAFTVENLKKGWHIIAVAYRGEQNGINVEFSSASLNFTCDESWKIYNADRFYSPICFKHPNITGYFKGDVGPGEYFEHLNGSFFPDDWEYPDFDDSDWDNATVERLSPATERVSWNYCLAELPAPKDKQDFRWPLYH